MLKHHGKAVLFISSLFFLAACSSEPPAPEIPLEDRVLGRWQLMIDRDFAGAWEFYSPGFRQLNPRETFAAEMSGRPVRWHEAELLALECEADRCSARLRVTFQPVAGPGPLRSMRVPSEIAETWLRLDGVWWFSDN